MDIAGILKAVLKGLGEMEGDSNSSSENLNFPDQLKKSLATMDKNAWMNFLKYGTHIQAKSQKGEVSTVAPSPELHVQNSSSVLPGLTPEVRKEVSPSHIFKFSKKPESATPFDPLKATEAGEHFRLVVVILAILGLILFLGWDWGVEALEKLGIFNLF